MAMASTAAIMQPPKIMQRPAAKDQCRVRAPRQQSVADPPAAPAEGEGDGRCERGSAGTTIGGAGGPPPATGSADVPAAADATATPPSSDKEEAQETAAEEEWNPLDRVDSALLSALCDPRERKALFRLEQVLLDFMRDEGRRTVEVGGAYNSIVLHPNGGAGGNAAGAGGSGGGSDGGGDAEPPQQQQGLQDLLYQQQRGLRQTSFQRLILHRLADRFDIVREQIGNVAAISKTGAEAGTNGQQPGFSPGLLRLVKTDASRAPDRLLIDIDLSVLVGYKNPRARNFGNISAPNHVGTASGGGGGSNFGSGGGGSNINEAAVRVLTEAVASTTLQSPPPQAPAAPTGSGGSGSRKTKHKMVVLKRDSSSGSNLEGSGKSRGSRGSGGKSSRKKKLEDREKAYEEARARIFGLSESSITEGDGGEGDRADRGEGSVPQGASELQNQVRDVSANPSSSCNSLLSLENDAASSAAASAPLVPSQLASSSASRSSPPSSQPQDVQAQNSQGASTPEAAESPRRAAATQPPVALPPAAATGGAVPKAVYRDRQREEADPDFRRRSDVRPAYVPYHAPPAVSGGCNPYATPSAHHAAMGHPGGNPYAAAAAALSPTAVTAMSAMHAPPQPSPPHFYGAQIVPGPTSRAYPTPQDVGGYPAPVAGGGAQDPRWTGTATPMRAAAGYFVPSQRQEARAPMWPPPQLAPAPQQMQTGKIMWGPGARGECGSSSTSDVAGAMATRDAIDDRVQPAEMVGKGGDSGGYKQEDFPALR
ncbi:hypothetical protein ACHAWF_011708 [Thalassiosira exigua]